MEKNYQQRFQNFSYKTVHSSFENLNSLRSHKSIENLNGQKIIPINITTSRQDERKFMPQLPLDQYQISKEPFTEVKMKPKETVQRVQKIAVRYLEPPQPEKPGDLIIRQLPNRQISPAPPLIIRQAPPRPVTPPPIYIREQPPPPLPRIETEVINIPGKILPPPPRQVIIEKLPAIPPKPQTIIIDKWLPYKPQTRRVIYENLQELDVPRHNGKNILIDWQEPQVQLSRQVINLGVYKVDPIDYCEKYCRAYTKNEDLNQIVNSFPMPTEFNVQKEQTSKSFYENEGDALQYLESLNLNYNSSKKRVSFVN